MEKVKRFFSYDKSLTSYIAEDGKKITLFNLALPIFFESVLRTLMNTVNSMVLSRYSETAPHNFLKFLEKVGNELNPHLKAISVIDRFVS